MSGVNGTPAFYINRARYDSLCAYDEETEAMLPATAGGLSVALANCFRIVFPDLKNPQTRHWAIALRVCYLLL